MALPIDLSRRRFLALAGTLPFITRPAGAASKVPVGLELYSVRDSLAKDLMGTVRAVAKLGYEVVEFYSPYYAWTPQYAAERAEAARRSRHQVPVDAQQRDVFTPDRLQKAIDLNQAIGSRAIIMASAGQVTGLDGWKAVADKLNAAAERLKPLGMTAGFHNHSVEWKPVEGQRPMDVLASRTTKDVTLQFDVGTCVEAGADPVAWIQANPGRIRSMHCKDWSAGGKGYAVLFGEGDAPWAKILPAAESVGGIEFYLIEQEAGPAEEQMLRAERCLANWKRMRS